MAHPPPLPLVQSFLICREVHQDRQTGEYMLLGPCTGVAFPGFPVMMRLSLFIQLTEVRGAYHLKLQMRDQDGNMLGECAGQEPVQHQDPLSICQICWRDLAVQFPRPGKYDLVLQANGEDLALQPFNAVLQAHR